MTTQITFQCSGEGGGGGLGDQLLSLELSEIDIFLLHLTCGRPVSAQLRVS